MNDVARKALCSVVSEYGVALCSTPRSFAIFLQQRCPEAKESTQLLVKALENGIVDLLKKAPSGAAWEAYAQVLEQQFSEVSGASPDDAQWVIESWSLALGKHPESGAVVADPVVQPFGMQVEDSSEPEHIVTGRALGSLMVVGGAGFFAALIAGCFYTFFVVFLEVRIYAKPKQSTDPYADSRMRVGEKISLGTMLVSTALAGALGGLGSVIGWMCVHGFNVQGLGSQHAANTAFVGAAAAFGATLSSMLLFTYFLGTIGFFAAPFFGGLSGAAGTKFKR